jgi:hypothetical protein
VEQIAGDDVPDSSVETSLTGVEERHIRARVRAVRPLESIVAVKTICKRGERRAVPAPPTRLRIAPPYPTGSRFGNPRCR